MRILHAASEAYPLAKTGGLADVLGALPPALAELGLDTRLLLPAYAGAREQLIRPHRVAELTIRGLACALIEGGLPGTAQTVWLLDCPTLFDRPGDPYHDADGHPHADNGWRFGCFAEAAAQLALDGVQGWRPDLVHAHDWQAALIPAWLAEQPQRPATLLTIHNLAYQGWFDHDLFTELGLPSAWWDADVGESWGGFSFLKAGLHFADALTTVSPNYAREIQTAEFGHGLDERLRLYSSKLLGLLNGIADGVWNPATDAYLPSRYDASTVSVGKAANKAALQAELGLKIDPDCLLVGCISRFAEQKGMDAVLAAAPMLLTRPLQLVVLGAGDKGLEAGFAALARAHPDRIALGVGYNEPLAHRIEAGADVFLMPSRFEPCGLNQLYSLRYGTLPLVRNVGGLADSVVNATPQTLADSSATGVWFGNTDGGGVCYAVDRALALFRTPHWTGMQHAGMAQDFSWRHAAREYAALYARVLLASRKSSVTP